MTKYRRRDPRPLMFPVSDPVEAIQFKPQHRLLPSFVMYDSEAYAVQTVYGLRLLFGDDWILLSGDQPLMVMGNLAFQQTYEPFNADATQL